MMSKIDTVTQTLAYIEHNRAALVDVLFREASPEYKREWLERSTVAFWQHLDIGNRRWTIELAESFYNAMDAAG